MEAHLGEKRLLKMALPSKLSLSFSVIVFTFFPQVILFFFPPRPWSSICLCFLVKYRSHPPISKPAPDRHIHTYISNEGSETEQSDAMHNAFQKKVFPADRQQKQKHLLSTSMNQIHISNRQRKRQYKDALYSSSGHQKKIKDVCPFARMHSTN
jgi:hypothetical protein